MKYKDCKTLDELYAERDRRTDKMLHMAKFDTPKQRHFFRQAYYNYRATHAHDAFFKRTGEL